MTIPLIQRSGPFQQLQQAVQSVMEQRQQRQAQALQALLGQAQVENTQASTARQQGETNRAQSLYDKTQQQEQEIQQAVALVSGVEPGSPQYDTAMASALATLKTPEQTIKFRDALRAREAATLVARRRRLYGGLLEKPTLANLTRAYEVALTNNDEEAARQFSNIIASHGYLQDTGNPKNLAEIAALEALTRQRDAAANRPASSRGGSTAISPEERAATQLRSHFLRLSGRKSRTGAPLYTPEEAMRAAIDLMGVAATPAVIARVRAMGAAAPASSTPRATSGNPYR